MFLASELRALEHHLAFEADYKHVIRGLAELRLARSVSPDEERNRRLAHYVEAVLSSCPSWTDEDCRVVCKTAGEIAEFLSITLESPRMALRACLLYELAELPAISGALAATRALLVPITKFLVRDGGFGRLGSEETDADRNAEAHFLESGGLGPLALLSDAAELRAFLQGANAAVEPHGSLAVAQLANTFELSVTSSECRAFAASLQRRTSRATRKLVSQSLFGSLRAMRGPAELFAAQASAIEAGLLDPNYDSWGLAAPTGTGKSFSARVVIADLVQRDPEARVLYVVPSRALVNEVADDLEKALAALDVGVLALSAQLVELNVDEAEQLDSATVIVLTPEKADLLLRLDVDLMASVRLVVVDEAHHIESGTRGALLELYLWRMKQLLPHTRFILLSAVTPNIDAIARWLGKNPRGHTFERRATRMRAGMYKISGSRGTIHYADGTAIDVVHGVKPGKRAQLVQLVDTLGVAGPVLTVAKGKKESEHLADAMVKHLTAEGKLERITDEELQSDTYRRLDSRLEREMYSTVPMRDMIQYRIAYHHAGLPPRVRRSVEEAIRQRLIRYVFATTTLAEGVNFPFSSVIVQSIAIREISDRGERARYQPVTARTFWNIAGRAGRPGVDREGQAILFEPTLGAERVNAVIGQYLNPELRDIPPVRSALAEGLAGISADLAAKKYSHSDLKGAALPEKFPHRARGTINLIRIGLVHAKAAGIDDALEGLLDASFAASFLNERQRTDAAEILRSQQLVLDEYLALPSAPPLELVAKLGLSLETLSELREYVHGMHDWQLEKCNDVFYGGSLNIEQAKYIVGPVAKRMAELEGKRLGGFLSDVIMSWLSGVPFTSARLSRESKVSTIEDLINVIYSRVQFLLPWGLYAMNSLVEAEAKRRHIEYGDDIQNLAYLADAGVPSFDALRLTNSGFERVDATRLAQVYRRLGGLSTGVDVLGWVRNQPKELLLRIVGGPDNRRVDFDFERMLAKRPDVTG